MTYKTQSAIKAFLGYSPLSMTLKVKKKKTCVLRPVRKSKYSRYVKKIGGSESRRMIARDFSPSTL